jgi:signal transduction histidine kinase
MEFERLSRRRGHAAEEIEHIFDAFFTTKAKGLGMGLSLCRTIVENHGGRLWASQLEEHGATFHLQLPLSDVPGNTAHYEHASALGEPASASE